MKNNNYLLIWLLLIIVGCSLPRRQEVAALPAEGTNVYRLGEVSVDMDKREIRFSGVVNRDQGWVQFLVYAHGYKWLREESAIIAEARLLDLQNAIALLDWRAWDDLWYGRESPRTAALSLMIAWEEDGVLVERAGNELIRPAEGEGPLGLGSLVFLGSPYFDSIALEAPPEVDCARCPLFALEEKALREEFKRESGQSGYEVNAERFPPKGTEVTIILQIPMTKSQ